jgi:hypothetical protein
MARVATIFVIIGVSSEDAIKVKDQGDFRRKKPGRYPTVTLAGEPVLFLLSCELFCSITLPTFSSPHQESLFVSVARTEIEPFKRRSHADIMF